MNNSKIPPAPKASTKKLSRFSGVSLEKFNFGLIMTVVFLLPLVFIPISSLSITFTKTFVLSILVILAFAIWLLARLRDGKIVLPGGKILLGSAALVAVGALSTLASPGIITSFAGQGFEVGTFASLLVLLVLMFLTSVLFNSRERIFYAYFAFFLAFLLISFFQILRWPIFAGPDFLSFGIYNDVSANLIGRFNDLGIFFGLGALLSLMTLELAQLGKLFKNLLYLTLIVSLVSLVVVNFSLVWIVLGLFALVFLVYSMSFNSGRGQFSESADELEMPLPMSERRIPWLSLGVLVVALVCLFGQTLIGNLVAGRLGYNQIEARPTWATTISLAKTTLASDPLLGVGPNRFVNQWLLNKPAGVNEGLFWNTDFQFGVGFVPTFAVTTGLLGILAWLLFLGCYLFLGFKAIIAPVANKISRYLIASTFLASVFLWIFAIFYTPSAVLLALTFLFTGLFIAAAAGEKLVSIKTFSFVDSPQKSFVSVLLLVLLLIATLATGYFIVNRFTASIYFNRALAAANVAGDLDRAGALGTQALNLTKHDVFYRFLVDLNLAQINKLLANGGNLSTDALRSSFRNYLAAALDNAKAAINLNGTSYENWLSLGKVYEAVVPVGIAGAYDSAKSSYLEALKYNPQNPAIYLILSRLELANKNEAAAEDYIGKALSLKRNYTEAVFLLAQIQVQSGRLRDAIVSVESATLLSPNDPTVFFQLGILRYNNKDFKGSVSALEQAIALSPNYANAEYFLGLSYWQLDENDKAIEQFLALSKTNPDNAEVKLILENLQAGRNPFRGATPPVDSKPEKRSGLPVKQ